MAASPSSPYTSLMVLPTDGDPPDFLNVHEKYICPLCKRVMRAPVQTECGHRGCKECLENYIEQKGKDGIAICPVKEDGCEMISKDALYPDFRWKKEIESLSVFCKNKNYGCQEELPWKNLPTHLSECDFRPAECPNRQLGCSDLVLQKNLKHHQENCRHKPVKCQQCGESIACILMEEHLKHCPLGMVDCPSECGERGILRKDLQEHYKKCPVKGDPCSYANVGCNFQGPPKILQSHLVSAASEHLSLAMKLIGNQEKMIKGQGETIAKLKDKERNLEKCLGKQQKMILDIQTQLKGLASKDELKAMEQHVSGEMRSIQECANASDPGTVSIPEELRQLIISHDRFINDHDYILKQMDLRVQCLEGASYDGNLLWKIQNFSQRRTEAVSGQAVSIYSQPFFTGRYGYKMCVRAYINGDGIGKGTHMSLFFVMMKGEYDALLKWPFQGKITFSLIDQEKGQRHLSDSFRADVTSNSFRRPTSEMNVATGCPCFVAVGMLDRPYLVSDTLFIRATVE